MSGRLVGFLKAGRIQITNRDLNRKQMAKPDPDPSRNIFGSTTLGRRGRQHWLKL
jgi:hypothetical protein